MPTTYTDQFYTFDPANPPPVGTAVTVASLDMVDQDDDGEIDATAGDIVNGSPVDRSWPGDTVTINVPGVGNVTYTGTTFYTDDGGRYFTPTDGQVLQDGTFVSATFVTSQGPLDVDDLGPPCFVAGTLIDTAEGERAVETIQPGDFVRTQDRGFQPVRWAGAKTVAARGAFAPVRITKGALGNRRDLWLSQQHRVLITGWRAQLTLAQEEVLIAAKHLCHHDRITLQPGGQVTYCHLLFEQHEVIYSEGIASESFDPFGTMAAEDQHIRAELEALFPELFATETTRPTARMITRGWEASAMMAPA
ncbi:MAG: Hint domain-containing protein [Pseudomonadota bacterium]